MKIELRKNPSGSARYFSGVFLFLLIASSGCQLKRQMKCSTANGNQEACREMSDDCMVVNDSRCLGDKICNSYCLPDEATASCKLSESTVRNCPRDSRIYSGGTVQDIEHYKFTYDKLSPDAKALAKKFIEKADFEKLTTEDKRLLCGAYPDDPCTMRWNEEKRTTECTFGQASCAGCKYQGVPIKCIAKNKCSGVICL